MAVVDAYVFPGFLTPKLTQLFFPKPPTTFLTCFCRGEKRKYAGKKSRLNRGSNSQPPGHESDTLTTEPPRWGADSIEYDQTAHICSVILLCTITSSIINFSQLILIQSHLINTFPSKPWFLPVCSTSLLKTSWEKEKLLITSNFSIFHSVFSPMSSNLKSRTLSVWKSLKSFLCQRS